MLFNDYAQVDTASNRNIVGTGLGLSITKRLVEQMHGKITADSTYGDGSTFSVKLMQKHVTDDIIGADVVESLKSFHYAEAKRRGFESIKRISLPYARVLIVDDVLTNLDVAKGLMKPYHMQIDCVTTGWEAVEIMHDESIRYNAIFMDHMMPGMDGIEATELIRNIDSDYARNIPIIALTANAIVGNEEMFLNKGFQAFVSKPIEISRLDAVIREWIRDKELEELYLRSGVENAFEVSNIGNGASITFNKEIPGVNVEKGLARFGGDGDAFLTVLNSFARNTPPLLDSAEVMVTTAAGDTEGMTGHLSEYETIVHGIKGSSGSICATDTTDLALALENAARTGNIDFIKNNHMSFSNKVRKLIFNIDKAVAEIMADFQKPEKDKPDEAILSKLIEACNEYEMNTVDELITELEAFDYTEEKYNDLVIWLRENAEQTNFDEIVERLEAKG